MIGKNREFTKSSSLFLLLCLSTLSGAQNTSAKAKDRPTQAAPVRAKDTRSLDETLKWIKQQLRANSGAAYKVTSVYPDGKTGSWKNTDTYSNFHFNGCEMVYNQANQKDNNRPRVLDISIPLWDMASASYELDAGYGGPKGFQYTPKVPKLLIRNRTKSMQWKKPMTHFPTDQMDIAFGGNHSKPMTRVEDLIRRLANTFTHAASLCAAQAPKSTKPTAGGQPQPAQPQQ